MSVARTRIMKNTIRTATNKRNRNSSLQKGLREIIKNNYSYGCCISGEDADGCDAAHLVPHSELKNLDTKINHEFNPKNAVLMNKTLHSYFDKYFFTFGTNILEECTKGFVKLDIILSHRAKKLKLKERKHSIFNYKHALVEKESLEFVTLRKELFDDNNNLSNTILTSDDYNIISNSISDYNIHLKDSDSENSDFSEFSESEDIEYLSNDNNFNRRNARTRKPHKKKLSQKDEEKILEFATLYELKKKQKCYLSHIPLKDRNKFAKDNSIDKRDVYKFLVKEIKKIDGFKLSKK